MFRETNLWKAISSSLAFLVRGIASQERGREVRTKETSGLKSSGSSARLDQTGLWQKMFAGYSQLNLDGFSAPSFPTWARWGIVLDGEYTGLVRSAPHTDEKEFLSWPTPTAIDSGSGRVNRSASTNAQERPSLALMARKGLWPTPKATMRGGCESEMRRH